MHLLRGSFNRQPREAPSDYHPDDDERNQSLIGNARTRPVARSVSTMAMAFVVVVGGGIIALFNIVFSLNLLRGFQGQNGDIILPAPSTLSLQVSKYQIERFCENTNKIVNAVRKEALSDATEALLWKQRGPFSTLSCEQLVASMPTVGGRSNRGILSGNTTNKLDNESNTFELQNIISLQRLAKKLKKLENEGDDLIVVAIGGSVTTGMVDADRHKGSTFNLAFPRKLEQYMQYQWPNSSLKVINISQGGGNEDTWLGRLGHVMKLNPDVILVESAVNNQCDYHKQDEREAFVHQKSFSLLNLLMNFPQNPAVISVELFRVAYQGRNDAAKHCRGHIQVTSDSSCFICPQWWMPQTWRDHARTYNGVSHSSYRDAVWPLQHNPPDDICSKYWAGLSHPEAGTHAMIASTILFQFLIVRELTNPLLQLSKLGDNVGPKPIETPQNICLDLISSYRAMQDDSNDPFQVDGNKSYDESCWSFRADVKRKFGWICEVQGTNPAVTSDNYLRLSKNLRIGRDRKVIVSRLVSYDDRMAIGQV